MGVCFSWFWDRLRQAPTLAFLFLILEAQALPAVVWTQKFSDSAQKTFLTAKSNYLAKPDLAVPAWEFARAAFDHAEFAQDDKEREEIALQGIAAARKATELEPENAAAHYYLALNLGQLARTKSLGALKLVREMEREFKRAIELDRTVDYAGPERSLGVLYLEAPGWPTSIGNKSRAREHLENALKLAPEFPENHLSLLEAYEKWHEISHLRAGLAEYKKILAKAHAKFTGPEWESDWADWAERYKKLAEKTGVESEP